MVHDFSARRIIVILVQEKCIGGRVAMSVDFLMVIKFLNLEVSFKANYIFNL